MILYEFNDVKTQHFTHKLNKLDRDMCFFLGGGQHYTNKKCHNVKTLQN